MQLRIVGKVVEQNMGGVVEVKKRYSQKLTEFNAPRCATVAKGNLAVEKQREQQVSSQVKYSQCRSVVYAPTHEQEKNQKRLWGANPLEKVSQERRAARRL